MEQVCVGFLAGKKDLLWVQVGKAEEGRETTEHMSRIYQG